MKVILKESVNKLGQVGDVVSVANGYGRNFLIPRGMAVFADEKNAKQIEHQKRLLDRKRQSEIEAAQGLVANIEKVSITISRKVGEKDKLFGSVNSADIAKAFADQGVEVDRRSIVVTEPIKALGTFDIKVKVAPKVEASIKVAVVADKEKEESLEAVEKTPESDSSAE